MSRTKLLSLLIGFCVLLAPLFSNAGAGLRVSETQLHTHQVDVVSSVNAADCHTMHDGTQTTSAKSTHGCCFNFVGMLPATSLIHPCLSSTEHIPFNPSLSLVSRVEAYYRPPRQNS
ncbi:MAG: hypothetical protein FGM53_04355 [Rhodocyclaceae bacterium]|nr:hypothetical protein [Rhodocyclaceae bacterium]